MIERLDRRKKNDRMFYMFTAWTAGVSTQLLFLTV
jgi:hypothetical protein